MIIITVMLFLSSLPNIIFLLVLVLLIISAHFCQKPSWTPNAKQNASCFRGVLFHFRRLTCVWISKDYFPHNNLKPTWSQLLHSRTSLGIEGRLASVSDKRRFSKLLEVIESFFNTRTHVGRHNLKNLQGRVGGFLVMNLLCKRLWRLWIFLVIFER